MVIVGVVVLIAANIADALLVRMIMQLGEIELNPMAPPLVANLSARGLITIAVILAVYLIVKSSLIWWLVLLAFGLLAYHIVEYYVTFGSPPA